MLNVLLSAGVLVGLCGQVDAHDWYPPDCCSGHDCAPIKAETIKELGYAEILDLVTGTMLKGGQIRESKDGEWHMCNQDGKRNHKPLCVFRPTPSY